jgi:hypothetical protein
MNGYLYTLGSVPNRPEADLIENKMDVCSTSEDEEENAPRAANFTPNKPALEFVINPESGRMIKSTGRVANRMVNEKLGIGQPQAARNMAQKQKK